MKVVFVHRGVNMASYRYRAKIPAEQLGGTLNGGEADIVVFVKPMLDDFELAKNFKSHGVKIVFDVNDPHFDQPIYRNMLEIADLVTCASEVTKLQLGRGIVIPDPYEENEIKPHTMGKKALWFGHQTNLKDLDAWKPYISSLNVGVLTGKDWSLEAQSSALREANIVLLPSRKGVEYKTANRLVNSLRAGCFPICSPHPSYEEFRQFIWIGDPHTALQWLSEFSDITDELVLAGQAYIRDRFSPEAIGQKWKQALETL